MISTFRCGVLLLSLALPCLVIVTFSAPFWYDVGFMTASSGGSKYVFGTLGYCLIEPGAHGCSKAKVGYDISIISVIDADHPSAEIYSSLNTLTKILVLFPITAGLVLLAFIVAIPSRHIGYGTSALIATIACVSILSALVLELVLFGIVQRHGNGSRNYHTNWGPSTWLTIAAFVAVFIGTILMHYGWIVERRKRRRSYMF
ncbi:uncharacterized protein EI90DRAFT_3287839 [Cantharellus anzutake]|uniref:uncharacterized protein n=1 Tax=Cantharellus anzutake TaxID=1750568 RepID=UPI0019071ED8|nr:uncharacterized protein EI90DRAFT_3287839 [Cantharellus anzutake]KAF8335975.1 hypothetical protein EI90DRAFT_3287839 [Cantharellus anzutake]